MRETGTYLCTNGPRLESKAEIQHFRRMGADVVGMTGMPEAVLARELELCYIGISVVTNHAAGLSQKKLTTTEVVETMRSSGNALKEILTAVFSPLSRRKRDCPCCHALEEAGL